jgi:phosphoadenosine phosphosulfate reductase
MIVSSPRITDADREYWGQFNVIDATRDISGRIDASLRHVVEFADSDTFCATSWGKDSVCVAALVAMAAPETPLYSVKTRRQNPDCDLVRDAFLAMFPDVIYTEICEPKSPWPHWGYGLKQIPFVKSIHGVRAAESSERSLSAAVHGVSTARMCRPILRWSGLDVFAFIEQMGLPLHPSYAMVGGGRWQRDRIRVGTLGGVRGNGIGRAEWEQEYYGDVLRRLAAG